MVRSALGFAGLFVAFIVGMKVIGFLLFGVLGLVFKVLWLAFLGWLLYRFIRFVSPSTGDRIRDTIKGKPDEA